MFPLSILFSKISIEFLFLFKIHAHFYSWTHSSFMFHFPIISAWHCSTCEVPQLKKCFLSFVMCFINTNVTQFLHCHCQPHSFSYFFYLTFPVYLPSNLPSLPFHSFRNQWIQRNKLLSWILILISILDKQDDPNLTGKKCKLVQLYRKKWMMI